MPISPRHPEPRPSRRVRSGRRAGRGHRRLQRAARRVDPGLGGRLHRSHRHPGHDPQGHRHGYGEPIVQEGANSPADVFLTENSPAMALVERAASSPRSRRRRSSRCPRSSAPRAAFGPGSPRVRPFSPTTPELLAEADLPASMLDLAAPEWEGRWGAAPAGADFQAIVSALLELRGRRRPAPGSPGSSAMRSPTGATSRRCAAPTSARSRAR